MRPAPYLPFYDGPSVFAPRMKPIDPACWLVPDTEAPVWLAAKHRLMVDRRPEVLAGLDDRAGPELLALVEDHTGQTAEAWPTALEAAASLVSDDFAVLRRSEAGDWSLVAASLCAPSYWLLAEKIGRSLGGLHGPVPGGDPELAGRISRVFDGLRPGLVLERFNWTVQRGGDRFTPVRPLEGAGIYLRVERQTLRKLPCGGEVVFTIRIAVDPLGRVLALPGAARAFAQAWRETAWEVAEYKAWPSFEDDVSAMVADRGG